MKRELSSAVLILAILVTASRVYAQDARARQLEQLASVPRAVPSEIVRQVQALGPRMRVSGKEETVLSGQLFDAAGNAKSVRVMHQLSGMVRIEGVKDRTAITFDGELSRGWSDRLDEALLETFVMDTIEGLIYSGRSGGAVRLLGRGFGADPRVDPDYKGPRYDIYEVIASVRTRQDAPLRLKRYYFDSQSGLLVSTRYTDPTWGSGIRVETRFSEWLQFEGSLYPGRIERFENEGLVFSFVPTAVSGVVRRDAANFR